MSGEDLVARMVLRSIATSFRKLHITLMPFIVPVLCWPTTSIVFSINRLWNRMPTRSDIKSMNVLVFLSAVI